MGLAAAGRPGVVTYSRKVFIPLTRLCRDRCHYCTFATTPGRVPSPYLSIDDVLDIGWRDDARFQVADLTQVAFNQLRHLRSPADPRRRAEAVRLLGAARS